MIIKENICFWQTKKQREEASKAQNAKKVPLTHNFIRIVFYLGTVFTYNLKKCIVTQLIDIIETLQYCGVISSESEQFSTWCSHICWEIFTDKKRSFWNPLTVKGQFESDNDEHAHKSYEILRTLNFRLDWITSQDYKRACNTHTTLVEKIETHHDWNDSHMALLTSQVHI